MRQIHIAGKEWSDFKRDLEEGTVSPGIFLVQGASEVMAPQIQFLLQCASAHGNTFSYFLCSGSEQFRAPCYLSFEEGEITSEVIDPTYLIYRSSDYSSSLRYAVIKKLERNIANDTARPRFLLIEYLSSPGQQDLIFASQLLYSPYLRRIPIVFFLHSMHSCCYKDDLRKGEGEYLAMLYLCGGRVREADWLTMINRPGEQHMNTSLIASRCLGAETWICYAHRGVAELAKEMYKTMSQQQCAPAQRVLQALPRDIGYPLLAIAAATGEAGAMQSTYSRKIVDAALLEPESVINYFDCLHQVAQRAGDDPLVRIAYTGYLLALLYADKSKAPQIYRQVQGACLDQIDHTVTMAFWSSLGGNLAVLSQPEAWIYAADCLRMSRELANALYDRKRIERDNWRFTLASIANTEALVAYKLGQGEQARQLEEFAISELTQVPASLFFQVHVRINFGDLFLRLLGDVKSAGAQYEAAFQTSLHLSKIIKSQSKLAGIKRNELRAVQKLGDALLLLGRKEEAIPLLEALLDRLRKVSSLRKEEIAQHILKARLALAKVYLEVGRPRSAVACYWYILRQSSWLTPEVLRDTATRLRAHRPGLSELQHRCIDGIINARDAVMTDVTTIQNLLSRL